MLKRTKRTRIKPVIYLLLAVAVTAVSLIVNVSVSNSQPLQCGERRAIIDMLLTKYGEVPVFRALNQARNNMVEWLVNYESGTWTMIATPYQGETCLVSGGYSWRAVRTLPDGDAI